MTSKITSAILRENNKNGVEYLTFPILSETGVAKHLFSTRIGGVSKGIFSTMNLSYIRGDQKENVDENFRRIASVIESDISYFVFSDQTHTTNVKKVTNNDRGKGIVKERDYKDIDGLITNEPGIVLCTFYADCVPLYFIDPEKKAIGLAHAGWRGTIGKIAKKTVEHMQKEYGSRPEHIVAAIGPSICKSCYEVSDDVAKEVHSCFSDTEIIQDVLLDKQNGKYQLDLWKCNFYIMKEAGILEKNIAVTDICTCCNAQYLFSHRASDGKRGNLGAFLMLK